MFLARTVEDILQNIEGQTEIIVVLDGTPAPAKKTARELFFDNKWEKQIYPLSWLIEKFWPVPGWTEEARAKIKAWPLPKK